MRSPASNPSPETPVLHPSLDVALSSLDVQLEEELARYRRYRLHQHVAPPPPPPLPTPTPAAAPEPDTTIPVGKNDDLNDIVDLTQGVQTSPPPASRPADQTPQDYLKSSEDLLKTLDQAPQPQAATPNRRPQLTSWYIGTAALMVMAAGVIGVAWQQSRVAVPPQATAPESVAAPSASSRTEDATPSSEPLDIAGPNLAESESGTIPTADAPPAPPTATAAAKPEPSPTKSPTLPGREPDLASAILPPDVKPDGAAPTDAPANRRDLPEPANVGSAPPASDRRYFVLMDYNAEADLDAARQAIPDAYFRRFGDDQIKIQMGVFDTTSAAQALVNQLKTQGVTAKIHQPNPR